MQNLSGRCLCGAVQYSCKAEPIATAICHCSNCQHQTGTAFSMTVIVPKESFVFEKKDTLVEYLDKSESGNDVQRQFCKNCGSPVLSLISLAPQVCLIKAGTLDDKSQLKPTKQVWCRSAQPWLELSDEIEKHDKNPVPSN